MRKNQDKQIEGIIYKGKEIEPYERKEIALKRMDMKEYKPRTDGISNTLTGVTKDNMLIEIADI